MVLSGSQERKQNFLEAQVSDSQPLGSRPFIAVHSTPLEEGRVVTAARVLTLLSGGLSPKLHHDLGIRLFLR